MDKAIIIAYLFVVTSGIGAMNEIFRPLYGTYINRLGIERQRGVHLDPPSNMASCAVLCAVTPGCMWGSFISEREYCVISQEVCPVLAEKLDSVLIIIGAFTVSRTFQKRLLFMKEFWTSLQCMCEWSCARKDKFHPICILFLFFWFTLLYIVYSQKQFRNYDIDLFTFSILIKVTSHEYQITDNFIIYSTACSGNKRKKTQKPSKPRIIGLCEGHVPTNSHHKGQWREMYVVAMTSSCTPLLIICNKSYTNRLGNCVCSTYVAK